MKLKNKFIGIIVVLGVIIFIGGKNPLVGLSNHKDTYLSETSTSDESRYMDETAAKALEELFQVAKSENINLIGSSAYRSYKSQVRVLKDEISSKGVDYANKYVAKPGKSEHQSGLSIDVTNEARCFDKTSPEAQWLANNAYRFGFILRYPEGKEDITGYNYEPWHIRYVGKDAAKEIYEKNITLEEYLNKIG